MCFLQHLLLEGGLQPDVGDVAGLAVLLPSLVQVGPAKHSRNHILSSFFQVQVLSAMVFHSLDAALAGSLAWLL